MTKLDHGWLASAGIVFVVGSAGGYTVGHLQRTDRTAELEQEIVRLEKLAGSEINEVKKLLATEITAILHGRAAAEQAAETARKVFEEGAIDANLPTIEIAAGELEAGIGILALFVKASLAASNGEARRHVQGGAVRLNDVTVSDEKRTVGTGDVNADGVIKLSLGKKKHVLVKPV